MLGSLSWSSNASLTRETNDYRYGINNFVYSARRPFHPRRLFALLHDKFIVLQNNEVGDEEDDGDDDDENDNEMDVDGESQPDDEDEDDDMDIEDFDQPDPAVILANKRAHPAFNPILRSKGFFWLATRPLQSGEWSQAGGMLTLGCGGPWFAEVPQELWPEDEDVRKSIENDFQEPWGDRRQEIVFIGLGIQPEVVTRSLDECLLDDGDMRRWEEVMSNKELSREEKAKKLAKMWEDGWEDWPEFGVEDEEEEEGVQENGGQDGRPKRKISEHLGHGHGHHHHHHRQRPKEDVHVHAKAIAA